jgi:hypothetical protein
MATPRRLLAAAILATTTVGTAIAGEDQPGVALPLGPLDLRATLDASAGAMALQNAQFGTGSTSRTGSPAGGRTWYEGTTTPGLEFKWTNDEIGQIYGRLSAVAAATRGQGDGSGTSSTSDQPEHVGLEDAYIGWRQGALDLSVGNQSFAVGDGFLIANGTMNGGGRAAYYLGPRTAFANTAIARFEAEPVRVDIFHLEGNVDQTLLYGGDNPDTRLYGANVEWFEPAEAGKGGRSFDDRKWYAGLTAVKVYQSDRAFSFAGSQGGAGTTSNRDGLQAYTARFGGSFIPDFDDFALYGEGGIERNDTAANGGTVRANAWHLQPQYRFSQMPWTPVVTARYAHFSGDGNGGDTVDRSWDPLFADAGPRGGGSWIQGLIYGNFIGYNSNLNTEHLAVELSPLPDELKTGLAFYRHNYDDPVQAGAQSKHLMDEIDLYAEWTSPIPGLTVSPAFAAGKAGAGQRQASGLANGADRTMWLSQIVLSYSF